MHSILPQVARRIVTVKCCSPTKCALIRSFYRTSKSRQFNVNSLVFRDYLEVIFRPKYFRINSFERICSFSSIAADLDKKPSPQSNLKNKVFIEWENEIFHAYLENNPSYNETIHKSNCKLDEVEISHEEFNNIVEKDCWTRENADNYFLCFTKVAKYCSKNTESISNPIFSSMCDAFYSKCIHFNDEQLMKCFVCLQNWSEVPGVRDENYLKIWKSLDSVCLSRIMTWDIKKMLLMMDMWYSLRLTRLSEFVMKSVLRCINKAKRFSQQDLVQLMFYLNTIRKVPKGQSVYELEYQLSNVIRLLSIEEIGIVCAGFFKTQNKVIDPKFIDNIIVKLIEHHENVDKITLASIFKLIRYSGHPGNIENIKKMFDVFSPIIHKYPFQVVIHFSLISEPFLISHPEMMNNLINRFLLSPADARLKDLEIIAKLMSKFSSITNEVRDEASQLIISELESENRAKEIDNHARAFIRCISYLSFNKYFSEKLSTKILNDDFLINLYENKYKIEREVLMLDQNIALEFPEYKGNKLSTPLVDYLCKRHSIYIPGMFDERRGPAAETVLKDTMVAVRSLTGDRDDFWHCTYFLPHFPRADVLIHLDKNNNLLPIPSEIKTRKYFTGYIKPPDTSGCWLIFVAGTRLNYTSDNKLTDDQACKIRQLQLLGYTPVEIPYYEFCNIGTPEERLEYIKKKVKMV